MHTSPARRILISLVCLIVLSYGFFRGSINLLAPNQVRDNASSLHTKCDYVKNLKCNKIDALPNGWCLTDDQVPRYVGKDSGSSLNISLYTHDGYTKCLAGKKVVFIGDSRVRYQYMHLASYIKNKVFMKCSDMSPYQNIENKSKEECILINEKLHGPDLGWTRWFNLSTVMLNDAAQKSLCDCYRPDGVMNAKLTFENRFTKRWTEHGVIELVYLNSYVNTVHISKQFPPISSYSTFPERCQPGDCSAQKRDQVFEGDLKSTLQHVLPILCSDSHECHAFINLGWDFKYGFDQQSKLSCLMEEYNQQHPQIKLNIITSPEDRWRPARSYFDESKLECKVGVLDRNTPSKGVPPTWYWDNLHVLSILNEEFNHRMIKMICPKMEMHETTYSKD